MGDATLRGDGAGRRRAALRGAGAARPGQNADVRSDVFTMGVLAYEMATATLPFDGRVDARAARRDAARAAGRSARSRSRRCPRTRRSDPGGALALADDARRADRARCSRAAVLSAVRSDPSASRQQEGEDVGVLFDHLGDRLSCAVAGLRLRRESGSGRRPRRPAAARRTSSPCRARRGRRCRPS